MEDYVLKAKTISKTYGENILNLLYERPGLFHGEICEILFLSPSGLSNVLEKLIKEGLIEKNRKGKYKSYLLSENVKSYFEHIKENEAKEKAKQERNRDIFYKTLFSNIISGVQSNAYVSYLSKDIEFTLSYFSGMELMMLLFALEIYDYGEGQNFASIFGLDEDSAIEIEQNLLGKFKTFLFEVIQKYNMPLDITTKER